MVKKIPKDVLDLFSKYKSKEVRFSSMPRKEYDNMLHTFIRYKLHKSVPHTKALLSKRLSHAEYLKRQREYMKKWRAAHPHWNDKHMATWKNKQPKKQT